VFFLDMVGRHDQRIQAPADGVVAREAEHGLGALAPEQHRTIGSGADDRIGQLIEQLGVKLEGHANPQRCDVIARSRIDGAPDPRVDDPRQATTIAPR
jgi:hypothetical protein